MKNYDVYLYGMVVKTNSFLLRGEYPKADGYGDVAEKYILPGGETGTAATVLDSLGCTVKMDGPHIGYNVAPLIQSFYADKNVDFSSMYFDDSYEGLEDYVVIDRNTRTPFGTFGNFFTDKTERWNQPREEDIQGASVAAIDPFFREASDKAAELCVKHHIPYVTIDCKYDSEICRNAAVSIISSECFGAHYTDCTDKEELFMRYLENASGLVIFTGGSKENLYGRRETGLNRIHAYKVDVVSTLGAGDTFKAACTYALLRGYGDEELLRFASACAAVACTRFPLPLNPPKLEEVFALMKKDFSAAPSGL